MRLAAGHLKTANLEKGRYTVEILRPVDFDVRAATGTSDAIKSFDGKEFKVDVEKMAELEYGGWNVKRQREDWRSAKARDNKKKIQPCLVSRFNDKVLTPDIKDYDRKAARGFPESLDRVGLEVFRK